MAEERNRAELQEPRRRLSWLPKGDYVVGIFSFLGGVVSAVILAFGTPLAQAAVNSLQAKPAKDIIALESLPDVIPASDAGVTVKGEVKSDLPSGKQLWAAVRQSETENDYDVGGPGFTVSNLCEVQPDRKFDCGLVHLVGNDEPGNKRFVVFVGTADSGAAKKLFAAYVEQERDNNYVHVAPRGFDAVFEDVTKVP